jgi:hypothetical protein
LLSVLALSIGLLAALFSIHGIYRDYSIVTGFWYGS